MSNIVELSTYRMKVRRGFLSKHGARLDRFIERFIKTHIEIDFEKIAQGYQEQCPEEAWDYVHFREILAEAFDEAFGEQLYNQLRQEVWFRARLFPKDEIVERCLSAFILGRSSSAIGLGR